MTYKQSEQYYENLEKIIFVGNGKFDIPTIAPEEIDCVEFIGVNYAKTEKGPNEKGVHFFVDDYQFTRFWNRPNAYIKMLQKFKCVFSPDFSIYTDFPKAMQIYNHYRKHWLGAYWQLMGIKVIPTIGWSDKESFEWCFDGEPISSTVAVSSVGTQQGKLTKQRFIDGYKEMMRRLKPTKIYFYGKVPEECEGNIVQIQSFQERFKHEV